MTHSKAPQAFDAATSVSYATYRLRHITVIDAFAVVQVKVLTTSGLVYSIIESTLFVAREAWRGRPVTGAL